MKIILFQHYSSIHFHYSFYKLSTDIAKNPHLELWTKLDEQTCFSVPHENQTIFSFNHKVDPHGADLEGHLFSCIPLDNLVTSVCQYQLVTLQNDSMFIRLLDCMEQPLTMQSCTVCIIQCILTPKNILMALEHVVPVVPQGTFSVMTRNVPLALPCPQEFCKQQEFVNQNVFFFKCLHGMIERCDSITTYKQNT